MNTAVLIIDMLNDFFKDGRLKEIRAELCKNINAIINEARNLNIKIIWVRQEFKTDLSDAFLVMKKKKIYKTIEDSFGAQILLELHKEKNDFEIIKKRYSAFYNTDLEVILNKNNIRQLIICGINTHACVRMAAIDAYQRDYEVVIAKEGVSSHDLEHHEISLHYMHEKIARVLTNEEIFNHLQYK